MDTNRYLATSGIRLNDCWFSEPSGLVGWTPPQFAGIFAIFVPDPDWAPKPFQPIRFGEFGNNAPLAVFLSDYAALLAAAKGKSLLIAVCPMPFSTTAQRWAMRDQLVWAYNPVCQAEGSGSEKPEPQREPRRRIGFMPETNAGENAYSHD